MKAVWMKCSTGRPRQPPRVVSHKESRNNSSSESLHREEQNQGRNALEPILQFMKSRSGREMVVFRIVLTEHRQIDVLNVVIPR